MESCPGYNDSHRREIRDWRDPGLEPDRRWAAVAVVSWLLASIQTLSQGSEGLHTDQSTNCIHTHIRGGGGAETRPFLTCDSREPLQLLSHISS